MKLNTLLLTLMLGASFAVSPVQAQDASPSELMKVTDYELVSKKRVGRAVFEYEYALTVENNTNTDYDGVFVTLTSPDAAFELTDASADIGAFNAFSSKDTNDTIKVRVDRRTQFNLLNLNFVFDNDTVEGIDTNENGIRDDVEQFVHISGKDFDTDKREFLERMAKAASALASGEQDVDILSFNAQQYLNLTYCDMLQSVFPVGLPEELWLQVVSSDTRVADYNRVKLLLRDEQREPDIDSNFNCE